MVQPVRQRRVDVNQISGRIDREEAARRVVEIFDRVLQFLEHVLLTLAVTGNVGDRPHRVFRLALAMAERPDPHPQPAAMSTVLAAVVAGDPDFLLLTLAFARCLEQAEHGFRNIGIADEYPLHRTHVLRARGARQRQVVCVGIDHMAARVGDGKPVIGVVGDMTHHRVVGGAVGEADDTRGESEQIEQPDHCQ